MGVDDYMNTIRFFRDGNMWCCVFGDFENLQESPAGFGATLEEAAADLLRNKENDNGA